jgi:hypothetical protein
MHSKQRQRASNLPIAARHSAKTSSFDLSTTHLPGEDHHPSYLEITDSLMRHRRMDLLNADLSLSNDFEKWNRVKNAKKRKAHARKTQAKPKKKDEEEPGFHFIAYVPINGQVWRLDGMQRSPVNLGMFIRSLLFQITSPTSQRRSRQELASRSPRKHQPPHRPTRRRTSIQRDVPLPFAAPQHP